MTAQTNISLVNEYDAWFLNRNDVVNRYGNAISHYLTLPGLIGFWPMSSIQRSTGNAYDLSGQNRTLTYNGNPTYNYTTTGVPYIALDGTGDYLSRADETDLDILGTEIQNSKPGLSVGCWVYLGVAGTSMMVMSKRGNAGNMSWNIQRANTDTIRLQISTDGTNIVNSPSTSISINTWHHVVGVFIPSTSVSIYVDGVEDSTVAGVPASIFNSTAALEIGSFSGGIQLLTGYITQPFLSVNYFSSAMVQSLYQQTRLLFGV